jgi:predicted acylesterase/phospholipase RssA
MIVLRRKAHIVCAAVSIGLSVQACMPTRLGPPPAALTTSVVVMDTPNARFFPVEQIDRLFDEGVRSVERESAARNVTDPNQLPPANFLAISGGGDDGAFGAGLLVGWSESGRRPEFKMVTGVSTGALLAPFAFLGPAYDEKLKDIYTRISKRDIFFDRLITAAVLDDALADTTPLFGTISRMMDETMLKDIAREYRKGRLLMIGTTDLDARRPVIWNIGAIAASGNPEALQLVRKILLASAAVPGAFPPVMIDVEAGGQHYQEMHVDGGAIAQLFLYPPQFGSRMARARLAGVDVKRERHAYIIRNSHISLDWSSVERSTLDIAGRAISTLIQVSGLNDLYRIYMTTQRDGVDFNLAFIGNEFAAPHEEDFDPVYMNALFEYGYA